MFAALGALGWGISSPESQRGKYTKRKSCRWKLSVAKEFGKKNIKILFRKGLQERKQKPGPKNELCPNGFQHL